MGKGIIIRVPFGTELSPELQNTLRAHFPDFILENYKEHPDYQRSFIRRIESLYHGFLFLLDAYPFPKVRPLITKEALRFYAEESKLAATEVKGSVDDLQRELEKYTARLIEAISLAWSTSSIKESIELLNEAEQYELMRQGRFNLATLMPIKAGKMKIDYILQVDESIPPYYDQVLEELHQIKDRKYPKTPSWLRNLEEYQLAYLCNLDQKIVGYIELAQGFSQFLNTWASIKKKSLNIGIDLQQIATDSLPLPFWFHELSLPLKEMIHVLAHQLSINIDKNLNQFRKLLFSEEFKGNWEKEGADITTIPQWYWVLSEHQQYFLEHALADAKKIDDALSFLSSRHRTLPLPANFAAHRILALSNDGEIRELSRKRYRSSHIATRDGLDWPRAVQQRHCNANLARVTAEAKLDQLVLLQTLISPIPAAEYVPDWMTDFLPTLPPDYELYKLALYSVEQRKSVQTILHNNHPLNIAKRLYYTLAKDEDCSNLLATAKKHIHEFPGLKILLDQYKNVLESTLGSATFYDYAGRELFLSSLEQLIILTLEGYSYGSCVSGKDRKAIELIHTDAMILYKEIYGSWPLFEELPDKENRIRFVALIADLYMSRHQQEHAGQNAPGSEGIKTPHLYLPGDVALEITKRLGNERALKDDDRIATNNEVKNIFSGGIKKYLLPENRLLCRFIARQIGEINCTKLYDALNLIINEKSLFTPTESGTRWKMSFFSDGNSSPDGIKQIFDLMHNPLSGRDNVARMEQILHIVTERPETDMSRTSATNSVYSRLRALLKVDEVTSRFDEVITLAIAEWTDLFTLSKESHSQEPQAQASTYMT